MDLAAETRRGPAPGRQVAAGGRCRLDPGADRRLLAIPEIGPWTVQCLGLFGRGEPDSLPAGDLGYIKLVGRLAGLGRRATIAEMEGSTRRTSPPVAWSARSRWRCTE